MKKLLCLAFVATALVGCGESTKNVTCKLNQEQNGVETNIEITYEYKGDTIQTQKQVGIIKASDEAVLEILEQGMNSLDFEGKTKDMKGVTYSLKTNKEDLTITEKMNIDITKISGEDYSIVTNGVSDSSGDKIVMDLEKTKEGMKSQGFECSE